MVLAIIKVWCFVIDHSLEHKVHIVVELIPQLCLHLALPLYFLITFAAAANKTASADKSSFSCGVVSLEVGIGASQVPLTLNLAVSELVCSCLYMVLYLIF